MRRARIVGLGSDSGGDDGVGLLVAAELAARGVEASRTTDPTALVELALDVDQLIVVDAVVGLEPVGLVRVLDEAEIGGGVQFVSSHAMNVTAALGFARLLYPDRVAPLVQIVGVAILAPLGPADGLSATVGAAIPKAVNAVIRLLGKSHA